jgi:hypothetical protein
MYLGTLEYFENEAYVHVRNACIFLSHPLCILIALAFNDLARRDRLAHFILYDSFLQEI